eukprot:4367183-Prymnesium_polylepis.2
MAEPQLPSFEPEDEDGWHLVFRQTSPYVWPKGKLDMCKFDHLSDNFAKLSELEQFRHPVRRSSLRAQRR